MMITKKISLIMCMALAAMLVTTIGGFAQYPTTCGTNTVVAKGTGASPLVIAVAANFYDPAKDMIGQPDGSGGFTSGSFLAQPGVDNITVTICSNSTGAFAANLTGYDMFFAADETALQFEDDYDAFLYANGLPVLFGWKSGAAKTITDVSSLLTQAGNSNFGKGIFGMALNPVTNAYKLVIPSGSAVAMANPSLAPYGAAAQSIIAAMYSGYAGREPRLIQFPNVGAAHDAVGTAAITNGTGYDIYSGFAGKSQICLNLPSVAYVEFPEYVLTQWAIQLNSYADGLASYIDAQISNGGWNSFLVGHCYGEIEVDDDK